MLTLAQVLRLTKRTPPETAAAGRGRLQLGSTASLISHRRRKICQILELGLEVQQ